MENSKLMPTREDLVIRLHHIGGIGGYGPAKVFRRLKDIEWVIYDADAESLQSSTGFPSDTRVRFVAKCLGDRNGTAEFNVLNAPSASSVFPPAQGASDYTFFEYPHSKSFYWWGQHTKIVKKVQLPITTIDTLCEKEGFPGVDFFSCDAQGSELAILDGASKNLKNSIVALVCETDFSEIYEGQPLFGQISNRLHQDGYRVCQIYNQQHWNSGPYTPDFRGKGFLTVGETLFLWEPAAFLKSSSVDLPTLCRVLKLALVSVVMDQLDHAINVLMHLHRLGVNLKQIHETTGVGYMGLLSDLLDVALKAEKQGTLKYQSSDISNVLRRGNAGTSEVARVYEKYGFTDLAGRHESRVRQTAEKALPLKRIPGFVRSLSRKIESKDLQLVSVNFFKGRHSPV